MIGSTFPRVSMLAGILLVPLLASTVVAFSECGSLVPGEGCILFRTDSGELYAIANADGFTHDTRVRVEGVVTLAPRCQPETLGCLEPEEPLAGCLLENTIDGCVEESDGDDDGVVDDQDNCPTSANPGQDDGDGDGVGDACDNCPEAPNPDQADGNGDGLADACEPDVPTCGRVVMEDLVLTADLDCEETALVVGADDVVIDGNGHILRGNGTGHGILNEGYDSAIIKNCTISNFEWGIRLEGGADGNEISNNTANANTFFGISVAHSTDNTLIGNVTSSNGNSGIQLFSASDNTISGNVCEGNAFHGVQLSNASNNVVESNHLVNSGSVGLKIVSGDLPSNNNLIANNLFDNDVNVEDVGGTNIWNVDKRDGVNIVGGPYLGGNFWVDYTGGDLDGDGLGDTDLPYTADGNIENGGDELPLEGADPDPVSTRSAAFRVEVEGARVKQGHGDVMTFEVDVSEGTDLLDVTATVHLASGITGTDAGASGWSVSVLVEDCLRITGATTERTVVGEVSDVAFEMTEVVDPDLPQNAGRHGVVSLVVLSGPQVITLPPTGDETVLEISGQMDASVVGAAGERRDPCSIRILGEPPWLMGGQVDGGVPTAVTVEETIVQPLLLGADIVLVGREQSFRRGNVNGDGLVDISDALSLLGCLFIRGQPCPECDDAADANDSGRIDVSDSVYILLYLFVGGSPPPPPALCCGADPTDDGLDCAAYPACDEGRGEGCDDDPSILTREGPSELVVNVEAAVASVTTDIGVGEPSISGHIVLATGRAAGSGEAMIARGGGVLELGSLPTSLGETGAMTVEIGAVDGVARFNDDTVNVNATWSGTVTYPLIDEHLGVQQFEDYTWPFAEVVAGTLLFSGVLDPETFRFAGEMHLELDVTEPLLGVVAGARLESLPVSVELVPFFMVADKKKEICIEIVYASNAAREKWEGDVEKMIDEANRCWCEACGIRVRTKLRGDGQCRKVELRVNYGKGGGGTCAGRGQSSRTVIGHNVVDGCAENGVATTYGRVLAHELGHSMGLPQRKGSGELMDNCAPGCKVSAADCKTACALTKPLATSPWGAPSTYDAFYTFWSSADREVNDLHVNFDRPVWVKYSGRFKDFKGEGTSQLDFGRGSIRAGGDGTGIRVISKDRQAKCKSCYWTINRRRLPQLCKCPREGH